MNQELIDNLKYKQTKISEEIPNLLNMYNQYSANPKQAMYFLELVGRMLDWYGELEHQINFLEAHPRSTRTFEVPDIMSMGSCPRGGCE